MGLRLFRCRHPTTARTGLDFGHTLRVPNAFGFLDAPIGRFAISVDDVAIGFMGGAAFLAGFAGGFIFFIFNPLL